MSNTVIRPKLYLIIFLFFNAILNLNAWSCHCISCIRSNTIIPVSTQGIPQIKAIVNRCVGFRSYRSEITLKPGEMINLNGFYYFARIETNADVCTKKCTYGASCPSDAPIREQCPSANPMGECDPALTSATLGMCDLEMGKKEKGTAVGICIYKSGVYLEHHFRTLLRARQHPDNAFWFNPIAALGNAITNGTTPPISGFDLQGCFPVNTTLLPPPFCKIQSIGSSDLKVSRICAQGEEPWRTLSGDYQECAVSPKVTSTFFKPCARITYDDPKEKGNETFLDRYYTSSGKERLYRSNTDAPDDKRIFPHNAKIRYANLYDRLTSSDVTTPPLLYYGYNDANYIDICGTIDGSSGKVITPPRNVLIDKFGNQRQLLLGLCTDPQTGLDTCSTSLERFQQNKFQVIENRNILGTFQRVNMPKPRVEFCLDTVDEKKMNDKNDSCMMAFMDGTYPHFMFFTGTTAECKDWSLEPGSPPLCTLRRSANPHFNFEAILTNRNYINAITINQRGEMNQRNCYPNKDLTLPQTPSAPPMPLPRTGACPNCSLEFGICDNKVYGAEKICLHGYAASYSPVAETWCKDSADKTKICNRVCAKKRCTDQQDEFDCALIDVANRIIPSPIEKGPLKESCPFTANSQFAYRPRNPIEDDLCVDTYTINYNKTCTAPPGTPGESFPPEIAKLCKEIKSFCTTEKTDAPNHYQHFDDCQTVFRDCLIKENSGETRQLGNIKFKCSDMQKFVS